MKSVRLGQELEEKLVRAARASGLSQSEFIRKAIRERCDKVLGDSLAERLGPVVGCIESSGGRAEGTGAGLRRLLSGRPDRRHKGRGGGRTGKGRPH